MTKLVWFMRQTPLPSEMRRDLWWTGRYAARFLSVFVALSFLRFDVESRPIQLPLTRAVGPPKRHEKEAQGVSGKETIWNRCRLF